MLVNLILFQSVWPIAVLGAARGMTWPAVVALGIFVAIHRFVAPKPRVDFVLLAVTIFIGFICDTVVVQSGLLSVTTTFPLSGAAPLWMLVLWANLALAINHCLRWLHERYWLAAAFGAVGGPVAYLAGAALGAAELGASRPVVIVPLAILWAIVTPLLFRLSVLIDRRLEISS